MGVWRAPPRHRHLLGMSEHTLQITRRIYSKLDLTGHFDLYLYAKRHGLARLGLKSLRKGGMTAARSTGDK